MHHKKVGSAIASALLATTSAAVAALATAPLAAPAATAVAATRESAHPSASAVDPIESMRLWRVQIRLTTGTTSTAGTTGHPAIRFNPTTTGVRTLNPLSSAAFSRGSETLSDVRLFTEPSAITMLRVGIAGRDDWCVQRVQLLLNERVAFSWSVKGGTCAVVKAGRNLDFSRADLRNSAAWKAYGQPPALPTQMSADTISGRLRDVTGSTLLSTPGLSWDRAKTFAVNAKDSATVAVSYGLIDTTAWPHFPRRVKVSFDVRFSRADDRLHAVMRIPSGNARTASGRAVAELDTALTRMTIAPLPHPPLSFSVDGAGTLKWKRVPVVAG